MFLNCVFKIIKFFLVDKMYLESDFILDMGVVFICWNRMFFLVKLNVF